MGVGTVDGAGMVTGAGIGVGRLTGSAVVGAFDGGLVTWLAAWPTSGRTFLTAVSPAGLADSAGLVGAMVGEFSAGAATVVGSGVVSRGLVVRALLGVLVVVLVVVLSGLAAVGAAVSNPGNGVDAVACGPDGWVLGWWAR